MNASCSLESRFVRALLGLALFASSAPFAAAQQSQTPPAKPTQSAAPEAGPTVQEKSAPSPESDGESEDYLRRRAEWFYGQRAYPLGFIPPNARLNALKEMDAMIESERKAGWLPSASVITPTTTPTIGFPGPTTTWQSIGPSPENNTFGNGFFGTPTDSGRVAAIAVDPTNSSTVYVGGAQGGIWKSTDAGAHFTPLTDSQPSLAIGSIALAPSNPSVIYVGTGEQDFVQIDPTTGGSVYYGAGILKSTDGGATWTQLPGPFVGPLSNLVGGARIPAIAVHPMNPNIVLAGVVFTSSGVAVDGIYRSADGGVTWTQIATASGAVGTGVVFNPSNGNTVYAAIGSIFGNANNGVYKSTDAGVTFTKLGGGLPTSNVGRIELAIAASAPNTVYASIANSSNNSSTLLGLWKTTDGGTTWTQVTNGANFDYCARQCQYSHVIAVSPVNPNFVLAGGTAGQGAGTSITQTLFRSTDGGATFTDIHMGTSGTSLHSDQHSFKFSADGTRAYVGNDGGAWRSDNVTAAAGSVDWADLNGALTLAQFYPSFAVDPSNGNAGFGGTQDNGTIMYSGNSTWFQVACGDGAWNVIDNQVPSTVYILCTSANSPYIQKSLLGGSVGTFFPIELGINPRDRREFIPAIALDPSNNQILYTPTFLVYQSMDAGNTWNPISPDLTLGGGNIAVVAVAKSDSNTVYASTDNALIWRTTNALSGAGATWTNLTTSDLPNRFITRIAIDRTNRDIVHLTYSGFTFGADMKGHIFKTTNGGVSWTDISGNLPNIPVNDIVVDPDVPDAIYVGTDIGVFQTANGGTTWTPVGTGLPRAAVLSLTGRRQSRLLYAATHGRGVWVFQLTNLATPAGPFLASISPSNNGAGSATFTLTVDGDHFLTGSSKVQWDGSQTGVVTTFVSVNQLTATIDTSLLIGGIHQINVFDATQAPNTSNSLAFAVTASVPSVASLSPASATAGGPSFTLTVNGGSFDCSGSAPSLVTFGSDNLTPTAGNCTSSQMKVNVPAADIATGGTVAVTAFTPPPGGGTSAPAFFNVNNPSPTITSLNPTSVGQNTGNFTLTVNGTGFVSTSAVNFGGNARTTTFVNSTQLTAAVLNSDIGTTGNVNVTVTNPSPGGGTSPNFVFIVTSMANPVPAINSLSPSPATAGAGFTLTVNGSNFVANSVVNVNGAARTTTFVSATQLTAAIPVSDVPNAGVVDNINVFNPAPGGGTSNAVQLNLTNPVPAITSLSPSSALVNSGAFTLTVNGSGFESTSVVNFGGAARATTFVSSTQLTAAILAGDIAAAGNVNVTVTNPGPPGGGTSAPAIFAVNNPAPVLTSIQPTTAAAGSAGFTLTANGSNFVASSVVQLNGAAKVTTFVSATQLTAAIPASDIAATGNFPVTVVTPGPGGGTSAPQTFMVTGPTITSLSPSSASAGDAGFTLTVNGSNFASGATVTWNGSDRVTTFVSAGQLTAAILASDLAVPAGTATVQVRNPGGVLSNTAMFTINGPAITTLSPSSAGVGGPAFMLTVNGSNFVGGSVVKFNGVAKVTTFVSATQLTAAIPASDIAAVGTPPVTVTNPGGVTSNAVNFTVAAPTIMPPLSPASVLAGSGAFTLNVTGSNFVAGSTVTFNGNARATTVNSGTTLSAAILAGDVATAGAFPVVVQNPGPVPSNSVNFTVNNPVPTTTSLSPSSVIAGSGAFTLTVNGTNFVNSSVANFNGAARTTTFVNSTQVTAAITAADVASAGMFNVTVTNPAPGGGTSNVQTLTVAGPTITGLSPSSATLGGAAFTLTVNGTNFVNASTVRWNGSARTTTFVSATQLTAAIPASDLAVGTGGTVPVTVANPGGATSNAQNFTINNPSPTITGLSPTSAPAGTAFTLTVNGTNFVSNSVVNFGGKAEPTTFVNGTKLTAVIPASDVTSGGMPAVTVTNPTPVGGTSPPAVPAFTLTDFTVSGPAAPVTVTAGQAATFTIAVAAGASGPFPNAVTFSAAGLPAATKATFNPTSVTPGSGSQTSTLTITTTGRSGPAAQAPPAGSSRPVEILLILGTMLALVGVALPRRGLAIRRLAIYLPLAMLVLGLAGIVGCSNSASGGGTPAGTSQIAVTAASGTAMHTTMVTLTVK